MNTTTIFIFGILLVIGLILVKFIIAPIIKAIFEFVKIVLIVLLLAVIGFTASGVQLFENNIKAPPYKQSSVTVSNNQDRHNHAVDKSNFDEEQVIKFVDLEEKYRGGKEQKLLLRVNNKKELIKRQNKEY